MRVPTDERVTGGNRDEREPRNRPTGRIQSLQRGCRILLMIAADPNGMSAKEVADKAALNISTVHHLLGTLVDEAMLARNESGRYVLGINSWILGERAKSQGVPTPHFSEAMHEIAAATGEVAYVSMWRAGQIEIVDSAEGTHPLSVTDLARGYSQYPHARASCKVLLAYASPDFRGRYLAGLEYCKLARNTITSRAEFERELDRVQVDGYAVDDEEYADDIVCISAPLRVNGTVVAALAVALPKSRYHGQEAALVSSILQVAGDVPLS